ncbi:RNA-binding protein 25-like [Ochlerotatus camptorhynchus]|uniref:RNA-binding protein 25-like n=1 Tax=Ochlerotatus camptorhynchus TaxID=644619 RepID=UPI0031D57E52
MDDDYDIYGDLDGLEVEAQKENKVIKELKTEIEDLKAKIVEKESEKQLIASKNEILLENISSLLLTAKAELKRKDSMIADIRRQMDNAAFRRDRRTVWKHDKSTQTTMIRILSQEAQMDSVGTMTEPRWAHERRKELSRSREVRREREKSPERKKSTKPADLRDRIREKLLKDKTAVGSASEKRKDEIQRWDRSRERLRDRNREREREKERRARHRETVRSPVVSPVRFSHPLRVSRLGHGKAASGSDAKLSQTFIPMNRKELDQFVKEIARNENRSPDECCSGSDRKKKDTLDTSNSELWDAGLPQKKKEKPVAVKVEEKIIQSDEIGTTLSPGNVEDVEQKMRVLHGEPTPPAQRTLEYPQVSTDLLEDLNKSCGQMIILQPPTMVIPPLEPSIIEQVPEMPFEDDPRLNDSRELRIVESEETVAEQKFAAKTVIAKWQEVEEKDKLEDGEIPSSDGDSANEDNYHDRSPPIVSDSKERKRREPTKQKSKREASSLDRLQESVVRKHTRKDRKTKCSKKDAERKSKTNRGATLDTSTPTRTIRCKSEREKPTAVVEKPVPKTRLSEPVKASAEEPHGRSKKETLKKLFGSDDENSLCEPPTTGKRKLSVNLEESKDSKKQRVRSKENRTKDTSRVEIKCFKSSELAPCEVVREQPITPPPDVFNKDLVLKEVTPEKAPNNTPPYEEPAIMDAYVVEVTTANLDQPLGEASPEEAPETFPRQAYVETFEKNQLSINASVEDTSSSNAFLPEQPSVEIPPDDTSHQDASMEEISVNLPQQDQPPPTATSDEVLVEIQQQDQPTQEVSVETSQNDHIPMDVSVEKTSSLNGFLSEQPSVDVPPQEDNVAYIEEIPANPSQEQQPPTDASPEEDLMETKQDQPTAEVFVETSQNDQLPVDAPLTRTPAKAWQHINQHRNPEVIIYSNKYSEYRVEDNSENETTIYVTRKKKKKSKSSRANLNTSVKAQ